MTSDHKIAFPQKALVNEEKLPEGSWPREVMPITLASPSVMSTAELAAWAQIGKNGISRLTAHFGIRELTGNVKNHRFSTHEVMRKIIGVAPPTAEELQVLLKPLQKTCWVSGIAGVSTSAISLAIRQKRLLLPSPIELTQTDRGQAAARGRRWIPAQIEAYLCNDLVPFLPEAGCPDSPSSTSEPVPRNIFTAICTGNAGTSRHRQQ